MGWGLGKYSPITLSLNKENYEALITRHGQWVRWRIASKCPCADARTSAPQPNCPHCRGTGERYTFQQNVKTNIRLTVMGNTVELPADYSATAQIQEIYDHTGMPCVFQQCGSYASVKSPVRSLVNGEVVDVIIQDSMVHTIEKSELNPVGSGFYQVPALQTNRSTLEGVYYHAAGDIIAIDHILDKKGANVPIGDYRRDMVHIEKLEKPMKEPYTAYGIRYVLPVRILVVAQNIQKAEAQIMHAAQGDALATFPYYYHVGVHDVISVLSGTHTTKTLINHREGSDVLPEFLVDEIFTLETVKKRYESGKDYVVTGTNRITWIGEPPEAGEMLSVSYGYHPTYRVVQDMPTLRTSEDQRLPRKVILKVLSGYSEGRRLMQSVS